MNNLNPIIIIVALFVLAFIVISLVTPHKKNKEKYNESNSNCGPSIRYSAPKKLDTRTYGNEYNEYPYNGYWSYQPKSDRILGCLNLCMLNTGTSEKSYNECSRLCQDA